MNGILLNQTPKLILGYELDENNDLIVTNGIQVNNTYIPGNNADFVTTINSTNCDGRGSATIIGSDNSSIRTNAINSVVLGGNNLIANSSDQLVAGVFNKEELGAAFIIGNGVNEDDRTNAFVVYNTGNIYSPALGDTSVLNGFPLVELLQDTVRRGTTLESQSSGVIGTSDYILLKDSDTGVSYQISMKDGQLIATEQKAGE